MDCAIIKVWIVSIFNEWIVSIGNNSGICMCRLAISLDCFHFLMINKWIVLLYMIGLCQLFMDCVIVNDSVTLYVTTFYKFGDSYYWN